MRCRWHIPSSPSGPPDRALSAISGSGTANRPVASPSRCRAGHAAPGRWDVERVQAHAGAERGDVRVGHTPTIRTGPARSAWAARGQARAITRRPGRPGRAAGAAELPHGPGPSRCALRRRTGRAKAERPRRKPRRRRPCWQRLRRRWPGNRPWHSPKPCTRTRRTGKRTRGRSPRRGRGRGGEGSALTGEPQTRDGAALVPRGPTDARAAIRRWRSSDAHLGLHAPGGNRVGQCRVIALGLVGIGLAEVGHGLVEGV